jgi:hypothetical protein
LSFASGSIVLGVAELVVAAVVGWNAFALHRRQ